MASLESLPDLCLVHIVNYLDTPSARSLLASCSSMRNIITAYHRTIAPLLTCKTVLDNNLKWDKALYGTTR